MKVWFVAKIHQQKKTLLIEFLSCYDVEVFVPHFFENGQRKVLFRTYVLIYLDPESSIWPIVRWAPGLMYFLPRDEKPMQLDEHLVAYLKERDGSDQSKQFVRGESVKIKGGAFDNLEGIFKGYMSDKERCQVFIKFVLGGTLAELPAASLASKS